MNFAHLHKLSQYAVAPGNDLLPDGFIDNVDINVFGQAPSTSPAKGGGSGSSGGGGVADLFKNVENVLSEDLVKKVNAVYAFNVNGADIL